MYIRRDDARRQGIKHARPGSSITPFKHVQNSYPNDVRYYIKDPKDPKDPNLFEDSWEDRLISVENIYSKSQNKLYTMLYNRMQSEGVINKEAFRDENPFKYGSGLSEMTKRFANTPEGQEELNPRHRMLAKLLEFLKFFDTNHRHSKLFNCFVSGDSWDYRELVYGLSLLVTSLSENRVGYEDRRREFVKRLIQDLVGDCDHYIEHAGFFAKMGINIAGGTERLKKVQELRNYLVERGTVYEYWGYLRLNDSNSTICSHAMLFSRKSGLGYYYDDDDAHVSMANAIAFEYKKLNPAYPDYSISNNEELAKIINRMKSEAIQGLFDGINRRDNNPDEANYFRPWSKEKFIGSVEVLIDSLIKGRALPCSLNSLEDWEECDKRFGRKIKPFLREERNRPFMEKLNFIFSFAKLYGDKYFWKKITMEKDLDALETRNLVMRKFLVNPELFATFYGHSNDREPGGGKSIRRFVTYILREYLERRRYIRALSDWEDSKGKELPEDIKKEIYKYL